MDIPDKTLGIIFEIGEGFERLHDCRHEDNAFGLYYLQQQHPLKPGERYVDLGTEAYVYKRPDGEESCAGFFGNNVGR